MWLIFSTLELFLYDFSDISHDTKRKKNGFYEKKAFSKKFLFYQNENLEI